MTSELVKSVIMILCFLLLLSVIAYIANKKAYSLFKLLEKGGKAEFTSKPGWLSLAIVLVVAVMSTIFLLVTEVKSCLAMIFGLEHKEGAFSISLAFFATIVTLIINFIFVGFMRPSQKA